MPRLSTVKISGLQAGEDVKLACVPCNQDKSNRDVSEFLAHEPARLARIETQRKAPLRDAAAVNSTRWAMSKRLKATGLDVEVGTGGRTGMVIREPR